MTLGSILDPRSAEYNGKQMSSRASLSNPVKDDLGLAAELPNGVLEAPINHQQILICLSKSHIFDPAPPLPLAHPYPWDILGYQWIVHG